MALALLIVAGYLAGSVPVGYWVVRAFKGLDIRALGSGNIGATNVWRAFGRRYGLPVMLLDIIKGFGPALAGTLIEGKLAGVLAGSAAMAGHWRPLFMRFRKGGKVVAATGGTILGVAPLVGGIGAGLWILIFLLFRYASVASMVAALSLPALAVAFGEPWPVIAFTGGAAAAVVVLHKANIRRLVAGTESRFELRRSTPKAPSSDPAP